MAFRRTKLCIFIWPFEAQERGCAYHLVEINILLCRNSIVILFISSPVSIYLHKVNNRNDRIKSLMSFRFLYCYLWTYLTPCSSVFIFNFENVIAGWIQSGLKLFNPFIPNEPFFLHPETIRNPYSFLIFLGGRERVHWEQMG